MAWLRPEVTTSEARYRVSKLTEMEIDDMHTEAGEDNSVSRKHARFDAATFYEAIKPSKDDPMLEDDIPDLLPQLRPYQRRAAYWMVQQEKKDLESLARKENSHILSPLCVLVHFADTCSKIFYNPFSGNVSMHPEQPPPFISGGVLAELIEATDSPVPTGATLIVCPAPILPQWHSEIIRHTNPSSLKICIYEGVRNTSSDASAVMDINELVNCDVVLTTYDVLKDDLSHDSDRHEGDRRFMRFQKRYLSFRLCLLEYAGGEFVWMRPKWLRAMLLQRQKWLCDCILSIAGVSQGLPFNVDLMTQILAIHSRLESFETWQARLEAIERGVPPPEDDRDRLHLHVDSSTMQFHRQQAQADLENVARLKEVVARLEMENELLRRSQACDQTQPQPSTNHSNSDSDH